VGAGDCADELIVGAPYSTVNFGAPVTYAGRIWVLSGSASIGGLDLSAPQWLDQSDLAPLEWTVPEYGDFFGRSLAVGALEPGGDADLAIGSPGESLSGHDEAGCVHLLRGDGLDLHQRAAEFLWAKPGFGSAPVDDYEDFGRAVAIGDFDGDGWGDVAIGLPQDEPSGLYYSGSVQILFGALFADGFERGDPSAWAVAAN